MDHDVPTTQARQIWESAAPGWARWEPYLAFPDATSTLLDAAGVAPGMAVLDLACGAGTQSLAAARRVGPEGRVLATDISATMLDHVRAAARDAGLTTVDTAEGAAEDLRLPPGGFDAAICRLGLMLFSSPSAALVTVRTALRPGARFAALVFSTPERNPFMTAPMAVLLRHAGTGPPDAGGPGLFSLGGDGVLDRLLTDAGLTDVATTTVTAPYRLPSVDDGVRMLQEAAGPYRNVVAGLDEERRAAAWSEVRDTLARFGTADGFEAELEFVVGSGARPS